MTQYSKMTFEEFVAYAKGYTIDACHPQIVDEAIARLNCLQADNERLNKENTSLMNERNILSSNFEWANKQIKRLKKYDEERDIRLHARLTETTKIQAYKEVFEKVNERLAVHSFTSNSTEYTDDMYDCMEWVDSQIEKLEKEMTGACK